jgi:predicted AAA+ superfamily ATPase
MPLHPVLLEKLNAALQRPAPPAGTRRDVHLPDLPNKVHAVTGMRRSGKTTFLRQLCEQRRREWGTDRALYLSFEDERLDGIDAGQLSELFEEYYRRHPQYRGQATVAWYLDEIQWVTGWDRFARRVLDEERIELLVSGSSAKLLAREVHTSLRGRGLETTIQPFSFREFLRHRSEEVTEPPDRWTDEQRSFAESRFRLYLEQGGFPEVQGQSRALRIQVLQSYVQDVIFRDVVERHAVTQLAALRWIVRHTLRNPAGQFSNHRLHQDLQSQGLSISKHTVADLLDHLEDAYLFSTVALETDSERQRQSNPRKLYPADPTLSAAFANTPAPNLGAHLETLVFNELQRRRAAITYIKTPSGHQIDFLARYPNGQTHLIQVCADPTDPQTLSRELRPFPEAQALHPDAQPLLLTLHSTPALPLPLTSTSTAPAPQHLSIPAWLLSHAT